MMSQPVKRLLTVSSLCVFEVLLLDPSAGYQTDSKIGAPAIAIVAALALAVELENKALGMLF